MNKFPRRKNHAVSAIAVTSAVVIAAALVIVAAVTYPARSIGIGGTDARYLDPIEMVCHYYPLEAQRVRSRADIQDALRLRWAACWTEGTETAGWIQSWGRYGSHADDAHEWSALLRRHAQEARMTRAEQAVWLEARYGETAERLALSAGVEYAMQHDGGPIFR